MGAGWRVDCCPGLADDFTFFNWAERAGVFGIGPVVSEDIIFVWPQFNFNCSLGYGARREIVFWQGKPFGIFLILDDNLVVSDKNLLIGQADYPLDIVLMRQTGRMKDYYRSPRIAVMKII